MKHKSLFENSAEKRCKECGRYMPERLTGEICPACEERMLFSQVRDYIRENDVRDWEVAEHFGIPRATVKRWIEEGRIQYKEEQSPRDVIMTNYCQICGQPTHFGTICPECMKEQKRKERRGVAVFDPFDKEKDRMQFMDRDRNKKE
ncbi:MAG: hypothetical protein K6B72_10060 [Lachnospiraceae bacterium]|nr:hypothetical protein [Lachnospiraceae bacterium]